MLGDYIVQVKTNSRPRRAHGCKRHVPDLVQPVHGGVDGQLDRDAGYNRYAMRAGFGTSSGVDRPAAERHRCVDLGDTNLPIYANAGADTTPTFYLARITPTAGSGRTLLLNLYDIGDVGNGSVRRAHRAAD